MTRKPYIIGDARVLERIEARRAAGELLSRVGITANRDVLDEDKLAINEFMCGLVQDEEVSLVVFGGARGGDTTALQAALAHRRGPGQPRLLVILPGTLRDQPRDTQEITRQADEVRELGYRITALDGYAAYHVRNQAIVDESDRMVAFWNEAPSGTGSTVKVAVDKGIPVTVVPMKGRRRKEG